MYLFAYIYFSFTEVVSYAFFWVTMRMLTPLLPIPCNAVTPFCLSTLSVKEVTLSTPAGHLRGLYSLKNITRAELKPLSALPSAACENCCVSTCTPTLGFVFLLLLSAFGFPIYKFQVHFFRFFLFLRLCLFLDLQEFLL